MSGGQNFRLQECQNEREIVEGGVRKAILIKLKIGRGN